MGENMYCGIGPIPRGKIRGTPEYCVQTNQIRYYGLEAIDKDLLKDAKGKSTDLMKEQLKFKKIEDDAKILLKEVKKLQIILEDEDATPSQIKRAQKRMDELMVKKEKIIKNLKAAKKAVDAASINEKNKKKKNSSTKTIKKSAGSKTSKPTKKSSSSGSKTSKKNK